MTISENNKKRCRLTTPAPTHDNLTTLGNTIITEKRLNTMKKEQIKAACAFKNMSVAELAKRMGTTRQCLASKLNRETFNDKELKLIAEILDCKYVCQFEFPDGTKI